MPRFKFCEIVNNIRESRAPTPADEASYIGLEHLDSGSLFVSRWGSDVPLKGNKLQMKKGDLLFGKRNAYLRRAAIAPHDGLFSAHGMVFRPNVKVIDERLFPFFVGSDAVFDAAIRISVGSLSPTVNWRDLAELEFKLPPLEVQPVIAEKLWAANETRESYKRLLSIIDDLVKSQFVEMFGDPLQRTSKWPLVAIEELFDVGSSKRVFERDWKSEGIPFYRAREIVKMAESGFVENDLFIDPKMYQQFKKDYGVPMPGDILVTGVGTLGVCYLVSDERPFYYKDGNIICLHSKRKISSRFVVECYRLPFIKDQIQRKAGGSTVGTYTIMNAKQTQIILPPSAMQQSFVSFVEAADKSKFAVRKSLEKLDAVYKALSKEAFG